jgi:hypothetical protein
VNKYRRERKKRNRTQSGRHSGSDHLLLAMQAAVAAQKDGKNTPYAVNCPVCRPPGQRWDRSLAGKAVRV